MGDIVRLDQYHYALHGDLGAGRSKIRGVWCCCGAVISAFRFFPIILIDLLLSVVCQEKLTS
jgi:hypothetical protein